MILDFELTIVDFGLEFVSEPGAVATGWFWPVSVWYLASKTVGRTITKLLATN